MAIVRILVSSRRPCDSEAFATWSYGTNFAQPLSDETLVSAAVSVVFAVVDVTNGANVDVRFGPIEFLFRHDSPSLASLETTPAPCRCRMLVD